MRWTWTPDVSERATNRSSDCRLHDVVVMRHPPSDDTISYPEKSLVEPVVQRRQLRSGIGALDMVARGRTTTCGVHPYVATADGRFLARTRRRSPQAKAISRELGAVKEATRPRNPPTKTRKQARFDHFVSALNREGDCSRALVTCDVPWRNAAQRGWRDPSRPVQRTRGGPGSTQAGFSAPRRSRDTTTVAMSGTSSTSNLSRRASAIMAVFDGFTNP